MTALRQLLVHREVFAAPVGRGAQAAHLAGDGGAGFFLPLPDLFHEFLAAQVVARDLLRIELALDHDLRGDAGVVGARNPQRVVAAHAVVARQAIHDGLVERMAHVQRAGDIGRRQLDGEDGFAGVEGAARTRSRCCFPLAGPSWPRWRRVRRTWPGCPAPVRLATSRRGDRLAGAGRISHGGNGKRHLREMPLVVDTEPDFIRLAPLQPTGALVPAAARYRPAAPRLSPIWLASSRISRAFEQLGLLAVRPSWASSRRS